MLSSFGRGSVDRLGVALDATPLAGRDAAFAREVTYGVVRRRRLLDFVVEPYLAQGLPEDVTMLSALRIGAYELLFMRTPEHAAVHEAVSLIRGPRRGAVNAVLRRVAESVQRIEDDEDRLEREARRDDRVRVVGGVVRLKEQLPASLSMRLAIEFSLPNFLTERWAKAHGGAAMRDLAAGSVAMPSTHLRATERLVASGGDLATILQEEGVETIRVDPEDPTVLRMAGGSAPPVSGDAFENGSFVVQNYPSVIAGRAVGAKPGETVIDYCAAPGTKTVQLSEAVGSDGTVWAFDIDDARRAKIDDNVRRLGLDNVKVVGRVDQLPAQADRVLADVPCSNTGVMSRRVEVRERITERVIDNMAREQRKILAEAAGFVRPGGALTYATCSIEHDENTQVAKSLEGFALASQRLTLPDSTGLWDGGYVATFQRKD